MVNFCCCLFFCLVLFLLLPPMLLGPTEKVSPVTGAPGIFRFQPVSLIGSPFVYFSLGTTFPVVAPTTLKVVGLVKTMLTLARRWGSGTLTVTWPMAAPPVLALSALVILSST